MVKYKKKGNKYEKHIGAELDLHGYTSGEAIHEVRDFIDDAQQHRIKYVRIIVGKGLRSENGSVLGPAIKSYLQDQHFDYSPAKLQDGGEGALIVSI